jgi:hypothetical protein
VYALHVPYGAPLEESYWWSVWKIANVWVPETRVLWEHSAAWIAVETLEAVAEKGERVRMGYMGWFGEGLLWVVYRCSSGFWVCSPLCWTLPGRGLR